MNTPLADHGRIEHLELELARVKALLAGPAREEGVGPPQRIRWAITVDDPYSDFPLSDANCFAIKFLDASFTKSTGLQTFSKTERSNNFQTHAFCRTGQWIPQGVPVPVFAQNGYYFFADPPKKYRAKLDDELPQGGSALASVYLRDPTAGEWVDTGVNLEVEEYGLNLDESYAAGMKGWITWEVDNKGGGHWVFDGLGCAPDDTQVPY